MICSKQILLRITISIKSSTPKFSKATYRNPGNSGTLTPSPGQCVSYTSSHLVLIALQRGRCHSCFIDGETKAPRGNFSRVKWLVGCMQSNLKTCALNHQILFSPRNSTKHRQQREEIKWYILHISTDLYFLWKSPSNLYLLYAPKVLSAHPLL